MVASGRLGRETFYARKTHVPLCNSREFPGSHAAGGSGGGGSGGGAARGRLSVRSCPQAARMSRPRGARTGEAKPASMTIREARIDRAGW